MTVAARDAGHSSESVSSTLIRRVIEFLNSATISRRTQLALVVALVAVAGIVRTVLFSGYDGLDDHEYARFAYLFSHGLPFPADYQGPIVFALRVGVYVPAAVLIRVLGLSEWTVVLYPFVISLAAVVLTYFSASFFFGWQAGVIAAALLVTFELDVNNATTLLPDLPSAFFGAVGVMLIAVQERRLSANSARNGSLLWNGILAGLAFGLAWLCKESIVYLVPLCLVLIGITLKRNGASAVFLWAGVAAGSLAVLCTEMATHWAITGDPLLRFHEVERNYRTWENGFFTAGSNVGWAEGTSYREALIDRLFVSGPTRILLDRSLNYLPLVGLAGAIYGWRRRDAAFLVPGLWLVSLVLMFNFGSSSLTSYVPLPLYFRYMYQMYIVAIILAAGFLARLLFTRSEPGAAASASGGRQLARVMGVVVAGVVMYIAAVNLYFAFRQSRVPWTAEVRALHDSVKPDTIVYSDALTLRLFEIYADFPDKTSWTEFAAVSSADAIPENSLVIVNKRYIEWLERNAGMWVDWPHPGPTSRNGYRKHAFYDAPPATWKEIWTNGNTRVYRVGRENPSLAMRGSTTQGEAR